MVKALWGKLGQTGWSMERGWGDLCLARFALEAHLEWASVLRPVLPYTPHQWRRWGTADIKPEVCLVWRDHAPKRRPEGRANLQGQAHYTTVAPIARSRSQGLHLMSLTCAL